MVKRPLERKWLHIHILNDGLYVFTDEGEWENHPMCDDWKRGKATTIEALDGECFVGNVEEDTFVRILLNPTIRYGKFGMPYVEEA